MRGTQGLDGGGGGGVAGHHQQVAAHAGEFATDRQHAALDLLVALVAVGHVGGVGVVAEIGPRQGLDQCRQDRKAAEARIEDANHAVKAGTRTADGVTVAVGASRQRRKARR